MADERLEFLLIRRVLRVVAVVELLSIGGVWWSWTELGWLLGPAWMTLLCAWCVVAGGLSLVALAPRRRDRGSCPAGP